MKSSYGKLCLILTYREGMIANIILLNKIDLVPGETDEQKTTTVNKVRSLCKRLNPGAMVVTPPQPKFEALT